MKKYFVYISVIIAIVLVAAAIYTARKRKEARIANEARMQAMNQPAYRRGLDFRVDRSAELSSNIFKLNDLG